MKLIPKTFKYFLLNKTRITGVFNGAGSEFDHCFLKFRP